MAPTYPRVEVTSSAELRAWLAEHHTSAPGVLLVTWKKADAERHVPYDEVVRQALCFGWIDSVARRVDEQRTSIVLTPRRARSRWSASNRQRVAELTETGLMAPAGTAAVEVARETGTWDG